MNAVGGGGFIIAGFFRAELSEKGVVYSCIDLVCL